MHRKMKTETKTNGLVIRLLYLFSLMVLVTAFRDNYADDVKGPYCASRPRGCCNNRQDECSVPILGTLCYCDDFCDRELNEDCCPDYRRVCKGIPDPEPPSFIRRCYYGDRYYNDGEVAKINCNECKCQEMGGQMEVLCENNRCIVDGELLHTINSDVRQLGFHATNYSMFWGRRLDEGLTLRLGTLHSRKKVLQMSPIKQIIDPTKIPRVFDARTKWPGRISTPRDQGWCGASWVFSTVGVASDRFAIMTLGNDQQYLSPQQLLNCNSRNQRGCNGGHLTRAWTFIRKFGLVPDTCYPWEGHTSDCQVPRRKNQNTTSCLVPNAYGQQWQSQIHRVGPVYRISGEQGIMNEIVFSGPVQAIMKISRDFFVYGGGIYRCSALTNTDRTGYHAVRIIGWGEEIQNGQLIKYWVVANSWGEQWGENGYFRIRKGSNECLIEEFVIAAWITIDDMETFIHTSLDSQSRGNSNGNAVSNYI